jgi:hypothetical protein
MTDDAITPAQHRRLAITCNNSTWEMIDADRNPANDEEMVRRAYAAAYHWQRAEGSAPVNEARAVWLISKVQLLAGQAERALHYADGCLELCDQHALADFDLAYALDARARALAALGRTSEATEVLAAARSVPIADPDDRAAVEADLATELVVAA